MSESVLMQFSTWYFCCPVSHVQWERRKAPCSNRTNTGCRVCQQNNTEIQHTDKNTVNLLLTNPYRSSPLQRSFTDRLKEWVTFVASSRNLHKKGKSRKKYHSIKGIFRFRILLTKKKNLNKTSTSLVSLPIQINQWT